MSEHLELKIDKEVFKLRDPKVEKLLNAKMSLELFAMMIRPSDPYIIIKDTIYALTEIEYYALRSVYAVPVLSDEAFKNIINTENLDFMSDEDKRFVLDIREHMKTCTSCQVGRYKDQIRALSKKYNIELPKDSISIPEPPKDQYPAVSEPIVSKVSGLLEHMYSLGLLQRKSCMDCVEKHISQAYILSKECLMGYPEHITYVVGHLGEAIDEIPQELTALKETLEFCLAKTNYDRKAFVPLGALIAHLNAGRTIKPEDDVIPVEDTKFELELTDKAKEELRTMPELTAMIFADDCKAIDEQITRGVENLDRNTWLGVMACAADRIVDVAPAVANIIRARRLVFGSSPDLMIVSGYGMAEMAELLPKTANQGTR